MITFTLDLEDHRSSIKYEKRYPEIIHQILRLLDQNSVKGTFFTVGEIAKNDPQLIKEISNNGHEIAFHSYDHKQLQFENADNFKCETALGKQLLEDITGVKVIGYRAPVFSLSKQTLWALDILHELDFKYSSSVLPASNPLNGFSSAPRTPFFWPNGLLEIPVPVAKLGSVTIPYLGGVYLRYLPSSIIKRLVEKNLEQHLWTYCHPYDFDSNEPFFRIKGASLLTSLILWFNRSNTENKILYLLSLYEKEGQAMTFSEQYKNNTFNDAPKFEV